MRAAFLLLAVLIASTVAAGDVASPAEIPGFAQLSPPEQERVLSNWSDADPERRRLMSEGLSRYFALTEEQRIRVRKRRAWFKGLDRQRQREVCGIFLKERGRLPYLCQVNQLP
ncbi:MAG: DUF3106 domain-containing protein [Gammaproteobacteria bacterium]|jgi:hypothetical protein|nr:DUF3106 domain-containing protein [Gammaproteobacteria bacterium]